MATDNRDLLDSSHWRPLRMLQESIAQDIAALYTDAGVTGVRPRFVGALIQLARHGSMTIQELATATEVTHSAMSQTAAAMRKADLVVDADNSDGRTRRIRLSDRARDLVPMLEAEWRATEATVRDLDAELPYSLSRVVGDINAALAARSFRERLAANYARARAGELR